MQENGIELFSLPAETRLRQYLATDHRNLVIDKITHLAGDASTRQYLRIHSGDKSLIAALYQERFNVAEQSFCQTTELFAQLPIPQIIAISGDFAIILLEDLGDIKLQDWLVSASALEQCNAYYEAVKLILDIQATTDYALKINAPATQLLLS